jgi:hypothetical protein
MGLELQHFSQFYTSIWLKSRNTNIQTATLPFRELPILATCVVVHFTFGNVSQMCKCVKANTTFSYFDGNQAWFS